MGLVLVAVEVALGDSVDHLTQGQAAQAVPCLDFLSLQKLFGQHLGENVVGIVAPLDRLHVLRDARQ